MSAVSSLDSDQLVKAARYHSEGMPWATIAARFGTSPGALRKVLDPSYRERLRETRRRRTERERSVLRHAVSSTQHNDTMLATVPPDTRSMQARFFGDPLPGRSALDRRQEDSRSNGRLERGFPRYCPERTQAS